MDGANDADRFVQLVLADSSVEPARAKDCAVTMKMHIPQQLRGGDAQTLGGYMAVPLRELRLGQGTPPFDTDAFLGDKAAEGPGVLLVLDSGSQGFWVIDFCEGKDGQSLLGASTLGSFVGDYELVLGDRGGKTFSLRIPQQWRDFTGADQLIKSPPSVVKGSGMQCLIVGNPWMQALAVTFDVSSMQVSLSHLDVRGDRCKDYQGPPSVVSRETTALAQRPVPARSRLPLRDGVVSPPSLAQTSLATAAPAAAKRPVASDVALDMRFMVLPTSSQAERGASFVAATESAKASDLVLPCLDVLVKNSRGRDVYLTQIFDTGSGVNLLMNVDPAESKACQAGECFCEGSGPVGQVFARNVLGAADAGSCGPCSEPGRDSKRNGGGICNTYCCTPEGVACDSSMSCSVSYCTGVVSYTPQIGKMSFPSEIFKGKPLLADVPEVFVGAARPACVPGIDIGLWGAWFWDSPLKMSDGRTARRAAGLPYYLLSALGQIQGKQENYTLKFWRSDLKQGAQAVPVGRPPRKPADSSAPTRPWWDEGGAPQPSPPPPQPSPPPPQPSPPPPQPSPPPPEPSPPPPQPSPPPPSSPPLAPAPGRPGAELSGGRSSLNQDGGVQQVVIIERERPDAAGGATTAPLKALPPVSASSGAPDRDLLLRGLVIAAVALSALLLLVLLLRAPPTAVLESA